MRHRIYYHIVWTTRGRAPLIDAGLATFLCRFLRQMARAERAHVLEIGMVTTHVHVLARAHPMVDIARLLQRLKGASSAIAGKERLSSSSRNLNAVRQYLRDQPKHHPDELIAGWKGDVPELDPDGGEEWRGEDRKEM